MTTLELEENAASPHLRVQNSPAQIVEIARSWIGTPYVHQASMKGAGCDCLGLLRGVWRELHGEEPETPPPYAPDWSEATGEETLYTALQRHLREIDKRDIAPGGIALFRMMPSGPAKHCGILANNPHGLTLIHARQNKQVSEEAFSRWWRQRLAFAFRLRQPNIREEGKHEI
jgi:NlpC/P60 family putative phage cell wall peptidase